MSPTATLVRRLQTGLRAAHEHATRRSPGRRPPRTSSRFLPSEVPFLKRSLITCVGLRTPTPVCRLRLFYFPWQGLPPDNRDLCLPPQVDESHLAASWTVCGYSPGPRGGFQNTTST